MIENIYKDLINKKIDGVISLEEESRLKVLMEKNPDVQTYYQEMEQSVQLLSNVHMVQQTENLKKRVMNSIDVNRYISNSKEIIKPFKSWWFNPTLKFTFSFAAGLVIGIVLYAFFLPSSTFVTGINERELFGTIGLSKTATLKTIREIPLKLKNTDGKIALKKLNNIIEVEININLSDNVEMYLEFNRSNFSFIGFKPQKQIKTFLDSGSGYVRITSPENINCKLFFNKASKSDATMKLQILSATKVYLNETVSFTN